MKWLLLLVTLLVLAPAPVTAVDQRPDTEAEDQNSTALVDRMHSGLRIRLDGYARYFDSFFADERADEEAADSQVRLIGSLRKREGGELDLTPRIKVRLHLPRLKHKVNLLIDTESDNNSTLADQLPVSGIKDETTIALQLIPKSTTDYGLSHRVGLSLSENELNPKFRSQVRFSWQVSESDLLRFSQSLFWERIEGFGQESRFDFEHLLRYRVPELSSLLRVTLRGLSSESSDGYEWSLPIEILRALSNRHAYSYGGRISGVTGSDSGITNSAVFFRYRQSLWRDWFFLDIMPQLEWPKAEGRNASASLKVSLEIFL